MDISPASCSILPSDSNRQHVNSSQWFLDELHTLIGMRLEPKKRKHSASVNVALGVEADLSEAASLKKVSLTPTSGRTDFILDSLRSAKIDNYLPPRLAATILGKLYFLLATGSYFGCGRAATQPLVARSSLLSSKNSSSKGSYPFTDAMVLMLEFFVALFRDLPPLVIHLGVVARKKVLVYSDASFAKRKDGKIRRKGLGIYVVDCENTREYRSSFACPVWLLNSMDTNAKTLIGPLELLAVLCAVLTFPEFLEDRQCVFFIDNTQALSACIHGYCRNTDMGRLCNLLHLSLAALRCQPFFNWVPSKANPADLPSREQGEEERAFFYKRKAQPQK